LTGGRCNKSTPFKGSGNRAALYNVIEQPLRFPSDGGMPAAANARGTGPHRRHAGQRALEADRVHHGGHGVFFLKINLWFFIFQKLIYGVY
jgi:hypothetical protein